MWKEAFAIVREAEAKREMCGVWQLGVSSFMGHGTYVKGGIAL
jgi:hypothetical protein